MFLLKRGRSVPRPLLQFDAHKPAPVAKIDVRPAAALPAAAVVYDVVDAAFGEIPDAFILQLLLSHFPAAAFRAFISAKISAAVFFRGVSGELAAGAAAEAAALLSVDRFGSNGSPGPIQRLTLA